jgi:hypothetical protein
MPALEGRLKTALDETRLLILGAQVLFGFHLNGAFQNAFDELGTLARSLHATAFFLMAVAIGLLIAPSMQHRIVEQGNASRRMLGAATIAAAAALVPFALSLGMDLFVVIGHRFGAYTGAVAGAAFSALALLCWFGAAWKRRARSEEQRMDEKRTALDVRIEQMLTEARVMLPGAQALLGFQLAILLTQGFAELPESSKIVHTIALCAIALAIILLMTPASVHRIAYRGDNTEFFHRLGSGLIVAAAIPLAAGIAGDLYVAVTKALSAPAIGAAIAVAAGLLLAGLWFVYPILLRRKQARAANEGGP